MAAESKVHSIILALVKGANSGALGKGTNSRGTGQGHQLWGHWSRAQTLVALVKGTNCSSTGQGHQLWGHWSRARTVSALGKGKCSGKYICHALINRNAYMCVNSEHIIFRCMDCGVPFCTSEHGCPLSNLIPKWNNLVFKVNSFLYLTEQKLLSYYIDASSV